MLATARNGTCAVAVAGDAPRGAVPEGPTRVFFTSYSLRDDEGRPSVTVEESAGRAWNASIVLM